MIECRSGHARIVMPNSRHRRNSPIRGQSCGLGALFDDIEHEMTAGKPMWALGPGLGGLAQIFGLGIIIQLAQQEDDIPLDKVGVWKRRCGCFAPTGPASKLPCCDCRF